MFGWFKKPKCDHEWKRSGRYHMDRAITFQGEPPIWGTIFRCGKCSAEEWVDDADRKENQL